MAADGQDQRVIADGPLGQEDTTVLRRHGAEVNVPGTAVDPHELAWLEHETAIPRLGDVIGLLLEHIARACRDRIQHGLPDICELSIDQGHRDRLALAGLRQLAGDLKPGNAPADHDHVMGIRQLRLLCSGYPTEPATRTGCFMRHVSPAPIPA